MSLDADLLVRRGFATTAAVGGVDPQVRGNVHAYRLGQAIDEAAVALRSSAAPWVLIADDACRLPADLWRRIEGSIAAPAGAGFRVLGPASERVYGRAHTAPPPWFCLVRRRVLEETGFFDSSYATAEFRLLELDRRLRRDGAALAVLALPEPELDTRRWAGDLIYHAGSLLRRDYARYATNGGAADESRVPPQLRVTSRGERVAVADLPEARARDAERPTFSVLCPVYKPHFLREMIDSVRAQSWTDWELLIAVDGPPLPDQQRIVEILESCSDDPRIVWSLQTNRGTGPTRRRLEQSASGEYIVCIDDDDMLLPEALEVFARVLEARPDARCLRAGAQLVGLVDQYLAPRHRLLVDGIPNDPFEVTQPYAIHRDALDQVGGFEWDESLRRAGEDTILFHKLDQAGIDCLLIDRPLYSRRLSTRNLSLEFEHDEAMSHFQLLDERFCPAPWRVGERRHAMDERFQRTTTVYADPESGREVVGATRFFQYQTLGDLGEVTIDLEVTSACNAVCGFCPREHMPDRKQFLPMEVVEKLADQLRDSPVFKQVVLCGIGESTLHPKLDRIVELLAGAGVYVGMTTNGSRMTPERFETLVEKGLSSFNFSLNGATPETHAEVMRLKGYEGIVENLEAILELRKQRYPHIRVHTSFVVCTLNEHEAIDFVEQWKSRDVTQVWLHPVNNRAGLLGAGLVTGDIRRLARRYEGDDRVAVDIFSDTPEEGDLCKIARSLIFISAEGETRLCAMDYQRVTSYGRVQDKNLQQSHFEKLRAYATGKLDDFCQGCDFCPAEVQRRAPRLAVLR